MHPNSVRTLESHGVVDQTASAGATHCDGNNVPHYMQSIKVSSAKVPYVEQCVHCGWIDGASLEWWADNAIKEQLAARAQRIAVAVETEPFSFAQASGEPLELREIVFQALAAASMCWIDCPDPEKFDSPRAITIADALLKELGS